MRVVDVATPISVVLTALVAIGTTLAIEEAGEEWIHAVWVVITVSLLVDMEPKIAFRIKFRSLARKAASMMVGLLLGVASGLIVRALHSWDSPRWTILVLRLMTECVLLFGAAIAAQVTKRISAFELALACATSSVALFCPRASLAVARVVAILFACAVALAVTALFWALELYKKKGTRNDRFGAVEMELIDQTLALAAKVLRTDPMDKEEVESIACGIKQTRTRDGGLNSHVRPLVFECYSLYWSAVAGASIPFAQPEALFCQTSAQFDRFFRPSLEKIEDGLDGLRSDMVLLLRKEERDVAASKMVHQWIASNLVEGLQGLEFHFTQTSKTHVFASRGARWLMASYLVNLSTMLVSVIGFVGFLLSSLEAPHDCRDSITDALNRVAAIQKLGSLADILALTTPLISAQPSRRASSVLSPIPNRNSLQEPPSALLGSSAFAPHV